MENRFIQGTLGAGAKHALPNRPVHAFLRGKVVSVNFADVSGGKQMVANVFLYNLFPELKNVPVLSGKINKENGETWDLEPDDLVAVTFLNGDFRDPVIVGCIPPGQNEIHSQTAQVPRYFRRRNGTSEEITKAGRRIVHVAENDVLEIVGSGTVTIGAGVTINVTGDATITVSGHTSLTSEGGVDIDGGSGDISGVVTKDCRCAFTGQPHSDYSVNVKGSKG